MKKLLLLSAIIAGTLFLLGSCDPQKEQVVQKFDRTEMPIQVTVFFYPNRSAVTTEYRLRHNIPRTSPFPTVDGFAIWPETRDEDGNVLNRVGDLVCEIHTVQPKGVDDNATLTLGHELLHCLYGSYHRGTYPEAKSGQE